MDIVELLPEKNRLQTPKSAKLERPEQSEEVVLGCALSAASDRSVAE